LKPGAFSDTCPNRKKAYGRSLPKPQIASDSKNNPDAHCLPLGFMQLHTHSQPRTIVPAANNLQENNVSGKCLQ
jgi:hypothetical protein